MRLVCWISSIVLIMALNLILLGGTVVPGADRAPPVWDGLFHLTDASLLVSSSLLGLWFWRVGSRWLGIVFGCNLVALAVAASLRLGGFIFPPLVLFGADLYWLNLYLVCLTRYGARLYRA